MEETNLSFKIVLIGDSGVGKSNLMTRYTTNEFNQETPSTIGVEFMTKSVKIQSRDAKIQIWDTAGQERFRAISRSIYHGAKGAMLVYDITNQTSFDSIPTWLQELRVFVPATCCIFLIGNKCDLEHLRVVKKEAADRFARENGLSFLETSALERTNVDKAFEWLAKSVYEVVVTPQTREADRTAPKQGRTVNMNPSESPETKKTSGCC
ncbi:small GTP-binding protein Rab11 [Leishmania donovani]|uniref:Small_GTP-binding_protein_Rab11_-_putative n=3 Tax=Leishmania donovani species complex TaxID=38574 RepID=A0A6L0WKK7_LEIIN|nr:putative small GTP-binding protein Rab11 [Leishmania infantum JPCM5]XP_003858932.1 small GTP-binding protein Rab11, putative [Leishmania donovani]CAC9458326.1 small_GTP-binding_protein_Rab11_-_putative [Leishmania infantum]AYU76718.1 small GTP-binding protein Rab11, putative [Leishmania donovani]TPP46577.1 Ras family protein [Leishmania donovani]TPP52596.1 Ras family protein [Leishmania donovani]CAJ1986777.1 small GTP-binding protein Rab11 [Leishmania donovani]|eukprot:XP_001463744.1 putative small GTP-binding protein Rab11 [Leishmania infantum JPCM5]